MKFKNEPLNKEFQLEMGHDHFKNSTNLNSSSTVSSKVKNLILILSMIYDLRLRGFQNM
jgi:hypothetical protein